MEKYEVREETPSGTRVFRLSDTALEDRLQYEALGGCTCFLCAPCSSCLHPGNPYAQEETPECWLEIGDLQLKEESGLPFFGL